MSDPTSDGSLIAETSIETLRSEDSLAERVDAFGAEKSRKLAPALRRAFSQPGIINSAAFAGLAYKQTLWTVDAMADAIKRLRALPEWSNWITFCAQGMGHDEDSERHAELRLRKDELQLDDSIDAGLVTQHAGVPRSGLTAVGSNYSVAQASPAEAARIIDAIFRHHLGIRPFPDQRDDYAIGAEW